MVENAIPIFAVPEGSVVGKGAASVAFPEHTLIGMVNLDVTSNFFSVYLS